MKRSVVINRFLSIVLLLAGLGLLYQSFNNQSWFMKNINEVLKQPETPTDRDITLTVGGKTKISNEQATEDNQNPKNSANLGAKDLSQEEVKTNNNLPVITLTSLEGGGSYTEEPKSDGVLKLKTDCWIEIKDSSQKVLVSGHNKKGKEFILDRTKTPFTAKAVCKPENLDFLLNGKKTSFKFNKKGSSYLLSFEF